jgi:hypothetical protein
MIELIANLPDDVIGFEAKGEVTGEDYEQIVVPEAERRFERHEKIGLLLLLGEEFTGYAPAALWADAKVGMHHMLSWTRIALVTDHDAYRATTKAWGFLFPSKVRVFDVAELDDAKAWVSEKD